MDWPLRRELDYAEEWIVNDVDKAVKFFTELSEKNPKSPRALYLTARLKESVLRDNVTRDDSTYFKQLNEVFDVYERLMDRYEEQDSDVPQEEYDIMTVLFSSVVSHYTSILAGHNMTEKSIEIFEKAMNKSGAYSNSEKLHLVLIQDNFVMNDMKRAEIAITRSAEKYPNKIIIQVT